MNRFTNKPERGSALIVVLWVIGMLAMIVSSFAMDAKIEGTITSYYRKRTKAEWLSTSGMEIAKMLMVRSSELTKNKDKYLEEEEEWWYESAKRLSEGLNVMGLQHDLGEGFVALDIEPEPARRNINFLGKTESDIEDNLERIFEVGEIPEEFWPELIESFLDWFDADNVVRVDGGETEDYYSTLEPPYKAKNGPLDTVDELLDVRGYSRPILEGGVIYLDEEKEDGVSVRGIGYLLTTSGDGMVNVNAASKDVLMTLPGVDDLVAGAIIEEREGWEGEDGKQEFNAFKSVGDVYAKIPELDGILKQYITTGSTVFRLTSTGVVGGVQKRSSCVASVANGAISILQWVEE